MAVHGGDGDAAEVLGVLVFRGVFAEMLRGARRVEKLLCAAVELRVLVRVKGLGIPGLDAVSNARGGGSAVDAEAGEVRGQVDRIGQVARVLLGRPEHEKGKGEALGRGPVGKELAEGRRRGGGRRGQVVGVHHGVDAVGKGGVQAVGEVQVVHGVGGVGERGVDGVGHGRRAFFGRGLHVVCFGDFGGGGVVWVFMGKFCYFGKSSSNIILADIILGICEIFCVYFPKRG